MTAENERDWRMDDVNMICPHCDYATQVECEDYCEGGYEQECEECGKHFMYHTEFSVTHHTERLEATNDR